MPPPGTDPEQQPTAERRSPFTRRRTLTAIAVLMGGTVALTACGAKGHADAAAKAPAAATKAPSSAPVAAQSPATLAQTQAEAAAARNASDAKITITPRSGSTGASVHDATKVTVTGGILTSVTMTSAAGGTVAGTLSGDQTSWQPNGSLAHGTQYTITATASDGQGRTTTSHATFATVSATTSFIGYFTPEDGSTVGVGMPVSINFDKPIVNKTAVQSHISVRSSSGQQVVGHWFSSTRLDLRPQSYWQAGSHVSLSLHLNGVRGAAGVYGVQDKTVSFTVGRSQVSTVDARTDMMTVVRDGKVIRTIPVSAGAADHATYGGQMVVSEKDQTTRMNGSTVGLVKDDGKSEYDIPDVPHAMRLSTSGTFIHGNYWAAKSVFGSANTSHGCIGLSDTKGGKDPKTPAAWFFDNSMVGDVVVVKNSGDRTVQPDNGLNGWNLTWSQWLAGSAL